MAKKTTMNHEGRTRARRRNNAYPLNVRKKLGPRSCHRGSFKRRRGQG